MATVVLGTAFYVTKAAVLFPLCVLVVCLAHRRHSAAWTSHLDVFTHHMVAMEMMAFLGTVVYMAGFFIQMKKVALAGNLVIVFTLYGENWFHILTCVDRYLAVVHPVTYLGLRSPRGVRIRTISVGCSWLLSLAVMVLLCVLDSSTVFQICLLVLTLAVISFCNVAVLHALVRPRPGDGGRDRKQLDQSMLRAFVTITVTLSALWLWMVIIFVSTGLEKFTQTTEAVCLLKALMMWGSLPNSMVLPLLYLHRAGPRCCCKTP
ncbi:uncharacterized protein V6R79_006455 [Siganus canaliculatus]